MQVTLVPNEYVSPMWGELLPYAERAAESTFGRFEAEDIFDMVRGEDVQLWVVYDESGVKGLTITRFMQYPRKRCLDVVFSSGDDGFAWKDPMFKILQHWAYDNNCDTIESSGRAGLARVFKDDGYRTLWNVFELPVAETGLGGQNG